MKMKLTIAAAALLAAGCSSGGTATSSPSATGPAADYAQAMKFSQCMRTHGEPAFPDPVQQSNGAIVIQKPPVDVNSAQFKAAQQACKAYVPAPHESLPPLSAQDRNKALQWVVCLRKHGFANLPDPTFDDNQVTLNLAGTGIDTKSSQAIAARQACRAQEPGHVRVAQ